MNNAIERDAQFDAALHAESELRSMQRALIRVYNDNIARLGVDVEYQEAYRSLRALVRATGDKLVNL